MPCPLLANCFLLFRCVCVCVSLPPSLFPSFLFSFYFVPSVFLSLLPCLLASFYPPPSFAFPSLSTSSPIPLRPDNEKCDTEKTDRKSPERSIQRTTKSFLTDLLTCKQRQRQRHYRFNALQQPFDSVVMAIPIQFFICSQKSRNRRFSQLFPHECSHAIPDGSPFRQRNEIYRVNHSRSHAPTSSKSVNIVNYQSEMTLSCRQIFSFSAGCLMLIESIDLTIINIGRALIIKTDRITFDKTADPNNTINIANKLNGNIPPSGGHVIYSHTYIQTRKTVDLTLTSW